MRASLRGWVTEFESDGPYPEDVDALSNYLQRVVLEERDVRKCVGLVKWFEFVVGDLEGPRGKGRGVWEDAVERVKAGVERAARARYRSAAGRVSFD